jgi:hypothetical protein
LKANLRDDRRKTGRRRNFELVKCTVHAAQLKNLP